MSDTPRTENEWLEDYQCLMAFRCLHPVVEDVGQHVWRAWLTDEEREVLRVLDDKLARQVVDDDDGFIVREQVAIINHLTDAERAAFGAFIRYALFETARYIQCLERSSDSLDRMIETFEFPPVALHMKDDEHDDN